MHSEPALERCLPLYSALCSPPTLLQRVLLSRFSFLLLLPCDLALRLRRLARQVRPQGHQALLLSVTSAVKGEPLEPHKEGQRLEMQMLRCLSALANVRIVVYEDEVQEVGKGDCTLNLLFIESLRGLLLTDVDYQAMKPTHSQVVLAEETCLPSFPETRFSAFTARDESLVLQGRTRTQAKMQERLKAESRTTLSSNTSKNGLRLVREDSLLACLTKKKSKLPNERTFGCPCAEEAKQVKEDQQKPTSRHQPRPKAELPSTAKKCLTKGLGLERSVSPGRGPMEEQGYPKAKGEQGRQLSFRYGRILSPQRNYSRQW